MGGGCDGSDCGGQHGGDGGCAVVISPCLGVCIAVVLAFVPPCGRNMQVSIQIHHKFSTSQHIMEH